MKRLAWFGIVFMICMGLTGCTVLNAWLVKADIKDIKGVYPPASGEAGRGDAIFSRYFLYTTEKARPIIESIPHMKVIVDNDNRTKSAIIGTEKFKLNQSVDGGSKK